MSNADLLVETTHGPVIGFRDTFSFSSRSKAEEIAAGADGGLAPVRKWLGIRYAQAKRFERSVDPEPWSEPRKAWEYGSIFPQMWIFPMTTPAERRWPEESEDSFFIDIYSPELEEGEIVPVHVYIYGGGLDLGSTTAIWGDPTEAIRANLKDGYKFIYVMMNYRTACFGFIGHPDFAEVDPEGHIGNYGFHDQIKAFEWIKANISKFQGDPNNITASGQSAGAVSVAHLAVSGRNLFKRGILMSGSNYTIPFKTAERVYPMYDTLIARFAPDAKTPQERVAALRAVPAQDLLAVHYEPGVFKVNPTIETTPDATWSTTIQDTIDGGKVDDSIEALIVGTTEHEAPTFLFQSPSIFREDQLEERLKYFDDYPDLKKRVRDYYLKLPLDTSAKDYLLTAPSCCLDSDYLFVSPMFQTAQAVSQKKTVYVYRLSQPVKSLSYRGEDKIFVGVPHCADLPLVFRGTFLLEGEDEFKMSDLMRRQWAHFIVHGKPALESWEPYSSENDKWLRFGEGATVEFEDVPESVKEARDLWCDIYKTFKWNR